jgi:tyrosyl-tRNA synthetase
MFGKIMAISDILMGEWYPLLLGQALDPSQHPMEAKKELACRIVTRFHGAEAGSAARAEFEKVFSKRELPSDMPVMTPGENPIALIKLLQETGAAPSGSEARRLIQQGAVSLDDRKMIDPQARIQLTGEAVLKCGKRFFVKLRPPAAE